MPTGKPSKFNRGLRIARKVGLKLPSDWTWNRARDYLDIETDGELNSWELDKVTDEAIKVRERTEG